MVVSGQVGALDKAGHDEADGAADLVGGGFLLVLLTQGTNLLGYVDFGTLFCLACVGSFFAVAGVAVNEDESGRGTAITPVLVCLCCA